MHCTAHGVQSRHAPPESCVLNKTTEALHGLVCKKSGDQVGAAVVQKAAMGARQCVAVWEAETARACERRSFNTRGF